MEWISIFGFRTFSRLRGEFPDDVSGAALGPIFTGHESERKWATEWDGSLLIYALTHDQWRWDPKRLPKRRREIYLAHSAKILKPEVKDNIR